MQAIAFRADSKGAWHAAVTAGLANLRARSCGINPVDALRAKLVSGLMALPLEGAGIPPHFVHLYYLYTPPLSAFDAARPTLQKWGCVLGSGMGAACHSTDTIGHVGLDMLSDPNCIPCCRWC